MPARVTVLDLTTGDRQTREVADGDYMLLTVSPCHRHDVQADLETGTHVITVKGHQPATTRQDEDEGSPR